MDFFCQRTIRLMSFDVFLVTNSYSDVDRTVRQCNSQTTISGLIEESRKVVTKSSSIRTSSFLMLSQ